MDENLGRKLVKNTMILGLKIRISRRIFFLPVKYCMSYSMTTHKIPDCMTRFWHANCMISLKGHRTSLFYRQIQKKMQCSFKAEQNAIYNCKDTGNFKDKERCCRPRITTPKQERIAHRLSSSDRRLTAVDIKSLSKAIMMSNCLFVL